MTEQHDTIRAAEDFVRAVLAKNFNQQVDPESARAAAEKIVRGLPVATESDDSRRAA